MEYISSHSCSINDGDSVVITGGSGEERSERDTGGSITVSARVARYKQSGFDEEMQDLNIGRQDHACGLIHTESKEKVFIR